MNLEEGKQAKIDKKLDPQILSDLSELTFYNITGHRGFNRNKNGFKDHRPLPTLSEMEAAFIEVRSLASDNPLDSLWRIYLKMDQLIPSYTRSEVHRALIPPLQSANTDEQNRARRVTLELNTHLILTGAAPFRTGNREVDDQILQEALIAVDLRIPSIYKPPIGANQRVRRVIQTSEYATRSYIMREHVLPQKAIRRGGVKELLSIIDFLITKYPLETDFRQFENQLANTAKKLNVPLDSLFACIMRREQQVPQSSYNYNQVEELIDEVKRIVGEKRFVFLELRFGLGDRSKPLTFEEIGKDLGYSPSRAQQVEVATMHKIRRAVISDPDLRDLFGSYI
jgi:hypothetical protein